MRKWSTKVIWNCEKMRSTGANHSLELSLAYKPTDRGSKWMGDREVRREGERDEDQGWYPHEIEQSPSQCTKRRVSTAAIRILFRICCIFFSFPPHSIFFFSLSLPETYKAHSHLDLIHQPKAFICESSHTFASELPPEVLMLNSQTTDSADHLSPELIWVIIIFWKDL